MKITVNSTPTCQTCKMAARRLDEAGANVNIVDLTEHPDLLLELKKRLKVAPDSPIQVPIFVDENDDIFDITGLGGLVERAKAVG